MSSPPPSAWGILPPAFGLSGIGAAEGNDAEELENTEFNRLSQEKMNHPEYREEWLPIAERDLALAKENDGMTPKSLFIYLPKVIIKNEEIGDLHGMVLPVGTKIYKGMRNFISCEHISDPATEACVNCEDYSWYSDYLTAIQYSDNFPKSRGTYCFQAINEIKLINLTDKRNLDLIVAYLERKIREGFDPGIHPSLIEGPSSGDLASGGEERTQENYKKKLYEYMKKNPVEQLKSLLMPLGYRLTPEQKELLKNTSYHERYNENEEPHASSNLEEEFGPQSNIQRKSVYHLDIELMQALRAIKENTGLPIHGYYSPIYRKFKREIALFAPKGLVRHAKEDPKNGCSQQGGKKKKRTLRKRTYKKVKKILK